MEKNELIHVVKLGRIRATIWENRSEETDEVWHTAVPSRLYKKDNQWKDATTFRRDELPIASKAMDMAHSWILQREVELKRAAENAA
ncbi:MAG: hypothetical protein R3C59_21760 [Planctomycetaceae bacterium]